MLIRCDNGPELISDALQAFCEDRIGIRYIPPGEPWNNGYIESFNNRVRDECLNMNQWVTLLHAQVGISDWKHGYNQRHRHSSLDYQNTKRVRSRLYPHSPDSRTVWHLKRGHPTLFGQWC